MKHLVKPFRSYGASENTKTIKRKNKLYLYFGVFVFFVFSCFCVLTFSKTAHSPDALARISPDVIAIRVIPNHNHYSPQRWYKEQGFAGSPQSLIIDGYEAIKEGRTVYVNAANISDQGTPDPSDDILYTNIYLMSYNQDADSDTIAIVNQLLQHWHFNTDLQDVGKCVDAEGNLGAICLIDSECPTNEYCNSAKGKVTRDTVRMARMKDIDLLLEQYKEEHGHYPKLEAGTYLPHATISVWPSWQETLGQALGAELPIDPINRLADCPGYDPITCWNEQTREFAWITDLNNPAGPVLPFCNYVLVYRYGSCHLCAGMETTYLNVAPFDCLLRTIDNNAPQILGATLTGLPKQEFIGYVSATDPDNDNLAYSINLITPNNSNDWVNAYLWEWDSGESNFTVRNTALPDQKEIHAAKAGNASLPGMYQIEITVDDGRGEINSVTSKIFDITINTHAMAINSNSGTVTIGHALSLALDGTNSSLNPLTQLHFNASTLNGADISGSENSHGFTIAGIDLREAYPNNDIQQTGNYIINVYALDLTTDARVDSFFNVTTENNPPVINSFTANYNDGTDEVCGLPASCSFIIDNNENTTVTVAATDPDNGHTVSYSLVSAPAELSINSSSGAISGFENLNYHEPIDATFDIEVKASDQYCLNSQEAECSITAIFSVTVNKWCTLTIADPAYANALHQQTFSSFILAQGETATNDLMSNLGFPAPPPPPGSCSKIGNSTADITASGISSNKAIIFVTDVSGSMDGQNLNPQPNPGNQPIDYAKTAIKSVLNDLHITAQTLPAGITVDVGLIWFSSRAYSMGLGDISGIAHKNNLITTVNGFTANGGTHTLSALNTAETMLLGSAADEKIVVLLSDGIPTDTQTRGCGCVCYDGCCPYCGCPCPEEKTDPCSGCSSGGGGGGGGGGSTYNNDHDFKIAITSQTQCLDTTTYPSCTASVDCPNCNINPRSYYSCSYNYNCDISADTATQAEALKNLGFTVYTIYYNTGGSSNATAMCDWSSDTDCPTGGTYAFSGTDVSDLFDNVMDGIFSRPGNPVNINNIFAPFVYNPNVLEETIFGWTGFDNILSCTDNNVSLWVNDFPGGGVIKIENIEFDYCEPLLHP